MFILASCKFLYRGQPWPIALHHVLHRKLSSIESHWLISMALTEVENNLGRNLTMDFDRSESQNWLNRIKNLLAAEKVWVQYMYSAVYLAACVLFCLNFNLKKDYHLSHVGWIWQSVPNFGLGTFYFFCWYLSLVFNCMCWELLPPKYIFG